MSYRIVIYTKRNVISIVISCIIAKKCAKLRLHMASLEMHRTQHIASFNKMGSHPHIANQKFKQHKVVQFSLCFFFSLIQFEFFSGMHHSFDIHYRQKLGVICFIRQIEACISPKLMVKIITMNFEPLLQVLVKYLL